MKICTTTAYIILFSDTHNLCIMQLNVVEQSILNKSTCFDKIKLNSFRRNWLRNYFALFKTC